MLCIFRVVADLARHTLETLQLAIHSVKGYHKKHCDKLKMITVASHRNKVCLYGAVVSKHVYRSWGPGFISRAKLPIAVCCIDSLRWSL